MPNISSELMPRCWHLFGGCLFVCSKDTLIISYTSANRGSPGTGGIKLPKFFGMTFTNITFINFDTERQVCILACSHCKPSQGGFKYHFSDLHFPGKSALHKASFKWTFEVSIVSCLE